MSLCDREGQRATRTARVESVGGCSAARERDRCGRSGQAWPQSCRRYFALFEFGGCVAASVVVGEELQSERIGQGRRFSSDNCGTTPPTIWRLSIQSAVLLNRRRLGGVYLVTATGIGRQDLQQLRNEMARLLPQTLASLKTLTRYSNENSLTTNLKNAKTESAIKND